MPVDNVKDLIEVTSTLTLSPVSYAYAGEWKCIATSNQGSAEQMMNLGVECESVILVLTSHLPPYLASIFNF